MKRAYCIVLALVMFMSLSPLSHAEQGYVISEEHTEQTIAKGVTYKKIFRFTERGVSNINIVEADLSREDLELDVIFNEEDGFSKRQKLSSMVEQKEGVLAAINGDFFSMSDPSFPLGAMVRDGKILSNPHYEEKKYASVIVDDSQNVLFEYLSPKISVMNSDRDIHVPVAAVNKPSKYFGNIVALTSEYVKNSPGASEAYYDLCEVVVDSGVVTDVRYGEPSVEIPEDGYVMVAGGNNGMLLRDSFGEGDSVQMITQEEMDYSKVKTAMGTGSVIIKDGRLTELTQKVDGKAQRSAIGITGDDKLIMFTVDGRIENYLGMEPEEVANYMLGLGCEDAVILDGGGSTELIARDRIRNTLSAGRERDIVNAFAVKTSVEPGKFDEIQLHLEKEVVYVGESVDMEIVFFDREGNPLEIDMSDVEFNSRGVKGSFENGRFTPQTPGEGSIKVSYKGESVKADIEVVEKRKEDDLKIDEIRHSDFEGGIKLAFIGDMEGSSRRLIDRLIVQKYMEDMEKIQGMNVVMIGSQSGILSEGFSQRAISIGDLYSSRELYEDTALVSLDNSSGTFYKTPGQWSFIDDMLDSDYDNMVIVFNSKSRLKFDKEVEIFKKRIYEKSKDKNIYVVYRGDVFDQTVEGNARYISIPDYGDLHNGDYRNDYRYLLMNISGDESSYGYMNVFAGEGEAEEVKEADETQEIEETDKVQESEEVDEAEGTDEIE